MFYAVKDSDNWWPNREEFIKLYLNNSLILSSFLLALLVLCLLLVGLLGIGLLVEIKAHQAKESGHQGQTHQWEDIIDHLLPWRLLHQRNHLHLKLQSSITWWKSSRDEQNQTQSTCVTAILTSCDSWNTLLLHFQLISCSKVLS